MPVYLTRSTPESVFFCYTTAHQSISITQKKISRTISVRSKVVFLRISSHVTVKEHAFLRWGLRPIHLKSMECPIRLTCNTETYQLIQTRASSSKATHQQALPNNQCGEPQPWPRKSLLPADMQDKIVAI